MQKAWCEDDCTGGLEGHIYLKDAWNFMFGTAWDVAKKEAVPTDHGDGMTYLFENGVEVWYGFDGGTISVPDTMVYQSVPYNLCCPGYEPKYRMSQFSPK